MGLIMCCLYICFLSHTKLKKKNIVSKLFLKNKQIKPGDAHEYVTFVYKEAVKVHHLYFLSIKIDIYHL